VVLGRVKKAQVHPGLTRYFVRFFSGVCKRCIVSYLQKFSKIRQKSAIKKHLSKFKFFSGSEKRKGSVLDLLWHTYHIINYALKVIVSVAIISLLIHKIVNCSTLHTFVFKICKCVKLTVRTRCVGPIYLL
jgi:hypothetical protein